MVDNVREEWPKEPVGTDGAVKQTFPDLLRQLGRVKPYVLLQHRHPWLDVSLSHRSSHGEGQDSHCSLANL